MSIGNQFSGLPMAELIGSPLAAVSDAQQKLAFSTAEFIHKVGLKETEGKGKEPTSTVRNIAFKYKRYVPSSGEGEEFKQEETELEVPLLSVVKIPSLAIDKVNISFDMEVKSSEVSKESNDSSFSSSAEASGGFWFVKFKTTISGSVSSHRENTRSTDTSAKYHVEVSAVDNGMSEGLARVLDIMNAQIVPPPSKAVEAKSTVENKDSKPAAGQQEKPAAV